MFQAFYLGAKVCCSKVLHLLEMCMNSLLTLLLQTKITGGDGETQDVRNAHGGYDVHRAGAR